MQNSTTPDRKNEAPFSASYGSHRFWWLFVACLGAFAFAIRYYYITHAMVFQPVYAPGASGDSVQYYDYALNLVKHSIFSIASPQEPVPVADNFRDPGYPFFLALLLKLSGSWNSWYASTLTCQAFLSALTVAFWAIIARRWLPMPWLVAAGILMAIWPHSVAMSSMLMSETLSGFLCALSMLLFRVTVDSNKVSWATTSGLAFALAALTNAVMLPFAAVLSVYMWLRRQLSARIAITCVAVTFLAVAPWAIRNNMLPKDHLSSSFRAWMNLVQGSWPSYHEADMAWATKNDPAATRELGQINDEVHTISEKPSVGAMLIWRRFAQDPWTYVRWYLSKPALLWGWSLKIGRGTIYFNNTTNSPYEINAVWRMASATCYGLNPLLLLLAAGGCLLGVRHRKAPSPLAATSLLLLFVTFVYCALQAEPRYSIPFRGAEILASTYAAWRLWQWLARKRSARLKVMD